MDIGQQRHAESRFDLCEYFEPGIHAWPSKRVDRRPVRFIKRGLEYEGNVQRFTDPDELRRALERQLAAFKYVYPADQHHRLIVSERPARHLDRAVGECHAASPRRAAASAASM